MISEKSGEVLDISSDFCNSCKILAGFYIVGFCAGGPNTKKELHNLYVAVYFFL